MTATYEWEVGCYYRAEFSQTIAGEIWEVPINRGIKVPEGTIFFCQGLVTKTEKHFGLDAEEVFEDGEYMRLICFDPRFPDTDARFINRDIKAGHRMSPALWKKITSPLVLLALVSAGLAF